MPPPHSFTYDSMGTRWTVTVWDDLPERNFSDLEQSILAQSTAFDDTYSRFQKNSLIWRLTEQRRRIAVPRDLVAMLRLYQTLFDLSDGKCNPLIGFTLSDLGYDADYSLKPQDSIRPVPDFHDALSILDDEHIELRQSVLIDLGALGKGFFVDRMAAFLTDRGIRRFLVDGSGDMFYRGNGEAIRVGLEHPGDTTKVIGVVEMMGGAMCSSAGNRRRWGTYHHTIDPRTLTSPTEIIATWVTAESADIADGLATCLFFCEPERFANAFDFEYCILNKEYRVKRSAGFGGVVL